MGKFEAAGGSSFVPVVFTNSSQRACFVRAYPGVAAVDESGVQIAQAERTLGSILGGAKEVSTITLAPGQSASAGVGGVDVPLGDATDCVQPVGLFVTPPDTRTSTEVRGEVPPLCGGLTVHPVVAGSSGGHLAN
ncbi:DUF4232 domain-containing protein [Kineococcus sp. NPDC059986]|uniref:DUF4232 domain-containing protein n=1 Tax=Kineococcus sp. NPDC059986 TaxID=3155538 RepID=UPI00344FA7D2